MKWVRLWQDMPTDPKWRTIARRSGQSIAEVMAVFNFMMVMAGSQEGSIEGWDDEDVAVALDVETEAVNAIREAMQGKVLDGDKLISWSKRQPKREDDSKDRVRRFRDKKKVNAGNAQDAPVTQCNADVTHDNAPDTEESRGESPPVVPPEEENLLAIPDRFKRNPSRDDIIRNVQATRFAKKAAVPSIVDAWLEHVPPEKLFKLASEAAVMNESYDDLAGRVVKLMPRKSRDGPKSRNPQNISDEDLGVWKQG